MRLLLCAFLAVAAASVAGRAQAPALAPAAEGNSPQAPSAHPLETNAS